MEYSMSELVYEKNIVKGARNSLMGIGTLQIYQCDPDCVRVLTNLLSESQMEELQAKVIEYLTDLLNDIEREMNE